jgi:hypothetical protein
MSQDSSPGKKRGLTRPIEVVRAELLKDADTKRIAKAVGMELEAYVELVLQYAQDKDKEPVLDVVEDERDGHRRRVPEVRVRVVQWPQGALALWRRGRGNPQGKPGLERRPEEESGKVGVR